MNLHIKTIILLFSKVLKKNALCFFAHIFIMQLT